MDIGGSALRDRSRPGGTLGGEVSAVQARGAGASALDIRTYGNTYIPKLVKQWETEFRKFEPGVTFQDNLPGTEAAVAGVYSGVADVSFVGREGYGPEIEGFKEVKGYAPLGVEISSGSFNTPHRTFSLQVFVHRDSPVTQLTMEQCKGIFGGGEKKIRTWGELGVKGPQASHVIHVYGYNFDTGMAGYFNRVVLGGFPENGMKT